MFEECVWVWEESKDVMRDENVKGEGWVEDMGGEWRWLGEVEEVVRDEE